MSEGVPVIPEGDFPRWKKEMEPVFRNGGWRLAREWSNFWGNRVASISEHKLKEILESASLEEGEYIDHRRTTLTVSRMYSWTTQLKILDKLKAHWKTKSALADAVVTKHFSNLPSNEETLAAVRKL